jgi:hypothetical protein
VLKAFEKFKQAEAKQYRFEFRDSPEMHHVEGSILGIVADLFSETFSKLDEFCKGPHELCRCCDSAIGSRSAVLPGGD